MKNKFITNALLFILFSALSGPLFATDHNEPNRLNTIFKDVKPTPTDLYGLFGYPSKNEKGEETLVVMMTFQPAPAAGVFESGILHTINLDPDPRIQPPELDGKNIVKDYENLVKFALSEVEGFAAKVNHPAITLTYSNPNPSDNSGWKANITFKNFLFPENKTVQPTNAVIEVKVGDSAIKIFVGGRDDPFFTDLNGFFTSIQYSPYLDAPFNLSESKKWLGFIGHARPLERPTTKSLLPLTKDGKFRDEGKQLSLVYDGRDSRAGYNANAIVMEIPVKLITTNPDERWIRLWGSGARMKAGEYVMRMSQHIGVAWEVVKTEDVYNIEDTLGLPFVDTVLGERKESFNTGAMNAGLQLGYVNRLAHLGYAFSPGLKKIGYEPCFKSGSDFPENKHFSIKHLGELKKVVGCLTQRLRMPDDSWNPKHLDIVPPRVITLFHPNTLIVDLDTTGEFPFGRRPQDQIASRFTSLFLDHNGKCGTKTGNEHLCNVDSLQMKPNNDAVKGLPINPVANDKPFSKEFPYLAEPWPAAKAYVSDK